MLFLSLLFILAGMTLLSSAAVIITLAVIAAGEKNLRRLLLDPVSRPPAVKRWARHGGIGLAFTLLGMLLAVIAT